MKIFTLITLFVALFAFNSFAQCKKEVDEFTGSVTVSSKSQRIGKSKDSFLTPPKFLDIYSLYLLSGDVFLLTLIPECMSIQDIDEGDLVYFKFTDDSIINFVIRTVGENENRSGEPFTQGTNATVWYKYVSIELQPKDREIFKEKSVAKIRCGMHDYTVTEKDCKLIAKQIDCIMAAK